MALGNIHGNSRIFRNTERLGTQYQTEEDDLFDTLDHVDVHHSNICLLKLGEYGSRDIRSIHVLHSLELSEIVSEGGANKQVFKITKEYV